MRLSRRLRRWMRRYFSAGGRVLWVAAGASAIVGVDAFRTQLAGLFVLAFSLTLAQLWVGWWMRVKLTGRLQLPPRAAAGSLVSARVTITNRSRRNGYDLEATLEEVVPGLGPALESLRCDVLKPDESVQLEVRLLARKRGSYRLGPAYVGTTYPLGILRLGQHLGGVERLLVTPAIHPIRSLRLAAGMRYQPGGIAMASQVGESLEFIGVRDYRQGDSPRKIHWKLWARRQEPVVREFSQEYFSRIGVILDSYRPPTTAAFEAAVECVASLAAYLADSDSIVDFFAAGPELHLLSMGRHQGSLERVLDVLACAQSCSVSPYRELQGQLKELLPRLSALLIVTFEPKGERADFLAALRQAGVPLRILAVAPPGRREGDGPEVSWIDPAQVALGLVSL